MDFKEPVNRTKNKFDEMDLDDEGQEVVCIQDPEGAKKDANQLQSAPVG